MKLKFVLSIIMLLASAFSSNSQHLTFSADSVQMKRCGNGSYIIKKDSIFYKKDVPVWSCIAFTQPELVECDITSFEVLKNGYAKDKDNVFYNEIKINKVDYHSFSILEINQSFSKDRWAEPYSHIYRYYAKDRYHVFYGEKILKNAEPETIELLSPIYIKDKRHAYLWGSIISNSDANSFTFIGGRFAKDKNHVYHLGKIISDNPDSFQIVDYKYRYAKDNEFAYHWHGSNPIHIDTIIEVNVENFKPLTHYRATDGEHIYWFGQLIPYADIETFKVINKDYSLDKNFVYYRIKKVSGADPHSFVFLKYYWGKDKDYIYHMDVRREDIDYKSFSVENHPRDKYYIYDTYQGERIKEVEKD